MLSSFVLVPMSVLITGMTVAWFTRSAAISGNVFTAGRLRIRLDDPQDLPFAVGNMAPVIAKPAVSTGWEMTPCPSN